MRNTLWLRLVERGGVATRQRDENEGFIVNSMARSLSPLLATGALAVAIAAAPLAAASPLNCTDIGSATQCASPGNSQITVAPPPVSQQPQYIIIHRGRR
jgi:hypothetical protein